MNTPSKKVARAARAGSGPSRRQMSNISWGYFGTLAAIALVGIGLLVVSITGAITSPKVGDHWHSAYGVWRCDSYEPPYDGSADEDPLGIHSHDDGLFHIHPFSGAGARANATLGKWFEAVGMTMSQTEMKPPGGTIVYKDGEKCGDQVADVRLLRFDGVEDDAPEVVEGDPSDVRFADEGEIYAFVFAPKNAKIPAPASAKLLLDPSLIADVAAEAAASSTTVPGSATTVAGSATTVAAATATTVAGSATTAAGSATVAGSATTAAGSATTVAAATATTLAVR